MVAGVVELADVGDDRRQLLVGERRLPERRHLPRAEPNGLRDLDRGGGVQGGGVDVQEGAPVAGPGVAGGALEAEQAAALGQVALGQDRYVGTAAARDLVDVVDQGCDRLGRVGRAVPLARLAQLRQGAVGQRLQGMARLLRPSHRGDRHAPGRQLVVERRPPDARQRRPTTRPPTLRAVAHAAVGEIEQARALVTLGRCRPLWAAARCPGHMAIVAAAVVRRSRPTANARRAGSTTTVAATVARAGLTPYRSGDRPPCRPARPGGGLMATPHPRPGVPRIHRTQACSVPKRPPFTSRSVERWSGSLAVGSSAFGGSAAPSARPGYTGRYDSPCWTEGPGRDPEGAPGRIRNRAR